MNEISRLVCILIGLLMIAAPASAQSHSNRKVQLDVPIQALGDALTEFGSQARLQVVFYSDVVHGLTSAPLKGEYTIEGALQVLLGKSELKYYFADAATVEIRDARANRSATSPRAVGHNPPPMSLTSAPEAKIRLAEAGPEPVSPLARPGSDASTERSAKPEEEVVITGSHIRGALSVSPVMSFTRRDFEQSGAATPQQFLALLPQNFGGGQSEDTTNETGMFNPSFGSAMNLRGLGSASTLVLVNGRRWAAAGVAEFVDISMIPLSAVERIEVLTDGASAVYGSDAIGGVVNFIMSDAYEGAETRLRGGASTHGDAEEYQATQSFGANWSSGNALLSYEYYRKTPIRAVDRDFSSSAVGPFELTPNREQHSAYARARQSLTEKLQVFADMQIGSRDATYVDYDPFSTEVNDLSVDATQYGGSTGISWEMGSASYLEIVGAVNRSDTLFLNSSPTQFGGRGDIERPLDYRLWSVDAKLQTDLFSLPGGKMKLALGAMYRDESYEFASRRAGGGAFIIPQSRGTFDVNAAFVELQAPVARARDASGASRLVVSLAGRHESHSEYGETLDPKYGIRWAPTDFLVLRGTYGTSFKAPSLEQLNEYNGLTLISNVASPTGAVRSISRTGNNRDLQEETARTWTFGTELNFDSLGLHASATYFDIRYSDRIRTSGVSAATTLNDPTYAGLAIRRGQVSDADFNALVAELFAGRINISGCALPELPDGTCPEAVTRINAVLDRRLVNLTATETKGIDFLIRQRLASGIGDFDFRLDASYLLGYDQQVTASAPVLDVLDTIRNPNDLRARLTAAWQRDRWSFATMVNYTDEYTDNVGQPWLAIDSWTTVDLNLRYEAGDPSGRGWLDGVSLSLNALNAFDEDPPRFTHHSLGFGYDPAGADPVGRLIAVTLQKNWAIR